jgi:predicted TIM-barrel fold metal-dependent hydrolase
MIIDCDTHFYPRDAFEAMPERWRDYRPVLKFDDQGVLVDIDFPGKPELVPGATPLPAPGSGCKYLGMTDTDTRIRDFINMGIERQTILPQFTGWWSYLIEPELGTAMAHSLNLAMRRAIDRFPQHLVGVALVALQDVDASIRELEWAKSEGFKAVVIDKWMPQDGHHYGSPVGVHQELWPFFEACETLEMPVYLHAVQHGHRAANWKPYQIHGLSIFAPSEGEMTLASLITSGLLDDFPKLQFVMAEQGTAHIKPLVERMDAAFKASTTRYEDDEGTNPRSRRITGPTEAASSPIEKNRQRPLHYFKNNFYWTIETEEPELTEAMAYVGPDRFLFATDYPHDDPGGKMKFEDVKILAADQRMSEAEKDLLRFENATRLFRL